MIVILININCYSYAKTDKYDLFVKKHSCNFDRKSADVIMFESYLVDKNKLDSYGYTSDTHKSIRRGLADRFVSPGYFAKYNVKQNTAEMGTYSSMPEVLICKKSDKSNVYMISAITNKNNGWSKILSYKLSKENGDYYITPTIPPDPEVISKHENEPFLFMITPWSSVINFDEFRTFQEVYK